MEVEVVLVDLMLPVKAGSPVPLDKLDNLEYQEQPMLLVQGNPEQLVLLEIPEMHLCLVLLYSLCPEGQEELEALLEMQVQ
jgi:hypothetical protein